MTAPVLVLGGGVTGMQAAASLAALGRRSILVEAGSELAGSFPLVDGFEDGADLAAAAEAELRGPGLVDVRLGTGLARLEGTFPRFHASLDDGTSAGVGAVVVATGAEPFDPTPLEEYGYRRYANVVTASELEWMLNPRGPTGGLPRRPSDGGRVERLAIVFCVGSRNPRIGAPFCSRICCSTSTKQALLVRARDPAASVTCFYMDVRTYDRGGEEMYALAQERGVRYVRGRVSGCKELPDGDVLVRAENTLVQRIHHDAFDLVALRPGCGRAATRTGSRARSASRAPGTASSPAPTRCAGRSTRRGPASSSPAARPG